MRHTTSPIGTLVMAILTLGLALGIFEANREAGAEHVDEHVGNDPYLLKPGIIAQNVLLGQSIDVCSESHPKATAAAVLVWNTGTSRYTDAPLFTFRGAIAKCATTDSKIAVSWSAPAYTGARPISGYRLRYTSYDGDTWRTWSSGGSSLITGTTTTITGLENGVLTGGVVAAENIRGRSTWSAHMAVAVPVRALTLSLESSRKLCTANTLTELSWTITGGIPPYTLTIEGESVDPNTAAHRVNCGSLLIDPQTEKPLPNQSKTFSTTVSDSRGLFAVATVKVRLATALSAPKPQTPTVQRTRVTTSWASRYGPSVEVADSWYLIRWRMASDSVWSYRLIEETIRRPGVIGGVGGLRQGISYVFAVAELRAPVEQLTPDALNWSRQLAATTATKPTGLSSSSTHDTITLTWDDQPSVKDVYVGISRTDGAGRHRLVSVTRATSPPNRATLIDLDPVTDYRIVVFVDGDDERILQHEPITVSTKAAPTGWQPPERGAQNLTVEATHSSVTVRWEAPTPSTDQDWMILVAHPSVDYVYRYWLSAPLTHTVLKLLPEHTYTITVKHLDLHGTEVSLAVTTKAVPVQGASAQVVGGPSGPLLRPHARCRGSSSRGAAWDSPQSGRATPLARGCHHAACHRL